MRPHPLARIPRPAARVLFVSLLVLTLGLAGVLARVGAPLKTPLAPLGIVSLEIAGDPVVAGEILKGWDASARAAAAFSLGLDFLFLVVYSTTLAMACAWCSERFSRNGFLFQAGVALAWLQWLAAMLDAIENVALYFVVFGRPASPWPQLAAVCASGKFLIITLGIAYCVVAVAPSLMNWLSHMGHRRGRPGNGHPARHG